MVIPADRIFDKMIAEISKAKEAEDPALVQLHAEKIRLLCELLLEEKTDADVQPSQMKLADVFEMKEDDKAHPRNSGGSLLDF